MKPLTLNAAQVTEWYSVSKTQREQRCTAYSYGGRRARYDLLEVLSIVLQRHGHAAGFTQEKRERERSRAGRGQQRQRAVRRESVDDVLAGEGLQAEWGPEEEDERLPWSCEQVHFHWDGGWERTRTRQRAQSGSPELHRALLVLGMICIGMCGWGGCGPADDTGDEEKQSDTD